MILKLNSFIQIGTFFYKKCTCITPRVALNFLDETRFSTSVYYLDTPLRRYNTRTYSLGKYILLAKTKEYTFLYMYLPHTYTIMKIICVQKSTNVKF